ncbi:hypothetical protein [Methylobacterium sp. CM6257]
MRRGRFQILTFMFNDFLAIAGPTNRAGLLLMPDAARGSRNYSFDLKGAKDRGADGAAALLIYEVGVLGRSTILQMANTSNACLIAPAARQAEGMEFGEGA